MVFQFQWPAREANHTPHSVRSPCPCINALANHGILPHNGKGITKEAAITALKSAVNLGSSTATVFAVGGVGANPDHSAHTFDLNHVDKHNFIEHDVSLTRGDIAFGSNCDFSPETWKGVWDIYCSEVPQGGDKVTSYESASKARYQRVLSSKAAHEKAGKEFHYGIKEVILSYGETALLLSVLGKDGVAPLEWIRVLVGKSSCYLGDRFSLYNLADTYLFAEEERLPYKEGWRPPTQEVSQPVMSKAIFNLIAANEHKGEEAITAGVGTIQVMKTVVESFIKVPSNCNIM